MQLKSMSQEDWEALFETALYSDDPVVRDQARGYIAQKADRKHIRALIELLDAQFRTTRRRAARIISEMRFDAVGSALDRALLEASNSARVRAHSGRILGLMAPDEHSALGQGLTDIEARVRRACACAAAPCSGLLSALFDPDREVVERAALALRSRGFIDEETLKRALVHHEDPPESLVRLAAEHIPQALAQLKGPSGTNARLDYLESAEELEKLRTEAPVVAAWGLSRLSGLTQADARNPDPRIRSAVARGARPDSEVLKALLQDEDPGVAWLAERAEAGLVSPEKRQARLGPHPRSNALSAQPPYGLQPEQVTETGPRLKGALALCHTRLDINLGVAMRSAEAAGLEAVWLVGRNTYFRSPARGTDHVLEIRHAVDAAAMVRMAREGDYQIVAIQQTPDSVPYHEAKYPPRPLFVMGSEDEGLPPRLRLEADLVVEIPMRGLIDSLNVAAAATTVLFHWSSHRMSERHDG